MARKNTITIEQEILTALEPLFAGRISGSLYLPDIDNNSGRLVPDKERLEELAALDEEVLAVLNEADTDFDFELFQATAAIADPNIKQHFVNINLEFKYITFNS